MSFLEQASEPSSSFTQLRQGRRHACSSSSNDDDDGDSDFENFLAKMRPKPPPSPDVSPPQDNPSLSEFIVSDSSDVEQSSFSYYLSQKLAKQIEKRASEATVPRPAFTDKHRRKGKTFTFSGDCSLAECAELRGDDDDQGSGNSRDLFDSSNSRSESSLFDSESRDDLDDGPTVPDELAAPLSAATTRARSASTDCNDDDHDSEAEDDRQRCFVTSLNFATQSESAATRKLFKNKQELVTLIYAVFNKNIFDGKLPSSMQVSWNVRMTKSAGFCINSRSGDGQREARIELSSKVCDSPGRIRDTLLHEMCHAAAWLIAGSRGGHDFHWKFYARKARSAFPEIPPVTTRHSYAIQTKFVYFCQRCHHKIPRHSKSINTEKMVCAHCSGQLQLCYSAPGSCLCKTATTPLVTPVRSPPPFAKFVKTNYKEVKSSNKNLSHAEVMKTLGEQFKKLNF